MNKEVLDALSDVSNNYVEDAAPRGMGRLIKGLLAAAAAIALIIGALVVIPKLVGKTTGEIEAMTSESPAVTEASQTDEPATPAPTDTPAVPTPTPKPFPATSLKEAAVAYPEEKVFPKYSDRGDPNYSGETAKSWYAALNERREAAENVPDMSGFAGALLEALMEGREGENIVCSPANIYLGLAMLAECTGGETREQILSALGEQDLASLRGHAEALIAAETNDDGTGACLFENSIWLNNAFGFYSECLEGLAERYGASGFWGDPSDRDFSELIGKWLDEKTRGTMREAAHNTVLDPNTMFALASTVYFKGAWAQEYTSSTWVDEFHSPSGDVQRTYMRKYSREMRYYRGENFTAVAEELDAEGGLMWMIVPDEGITVEELLSGGGMEFLLSEKRSLGYGYKVDITVPMIGVSSEIELEQALKKLGVTDCFDPSRSDFSGLCPDAEGLTLDIAKHATRIRTDEKGLEASSYVVYGATYSEPQHVKVIIDRPFAIEITGQSGAPLFLGIVNDPAD